MTAPSTVLHQALGRQGHTVRSTGTASTLVAMGPGRGGQLVITDVVMPDENGLDLVPRIRKLRPDLRIIVMSAQSTCSRPSARPSACRSNTCRSPST